MEEDVDIADISPIDLDMLILKELGLAEIFRYLSDHPQITGSGITGALCRHVDW